MSGAGKLKRTFLCLAVLTSCLALFSWQSDNRTDISSQDTTLSIAEQDKSYTDSSSTDSDSSREAQTTTTTATAASGAVNTSASAGEETVLYIHMYDYTLFKDKDNIFRLKNKDSVLVESAEVEADNKDIIKITCKDNKVTFKKGDTEITEFVFNKQKVEKKGDEIYYGGKKMAYTDRAYSSYDFGGGLVLKHESSGKFKLYKDGKEVVQSTFKADDGTELTIKAARNGQGVTVTDPSGKTLTYFQHGGQVVNVSEDSVTIGGKKLMPANSSDVSTAASTTTTTPRQTIANWDSTDTTALTLETWNTQKATTKATTKKPAASSSSGGNVVIANPIYPQNDGRNVKIKSVQDYSAQFVSLLKSRGIRTDVTADTHGKLLEAAKMRAEEYTYYPKNAHTRPAARAVGGSREYHTVFTNVGIKAYLLNRNKASVENLCNGWGGDDETVHGKPEWALETWLASKDDPPNHKDNILNTNIKKISVVCVTTEETRIGYTVTGHYWVMLGFTNDIA